MSITAIFLPEKCLVHCEMLAKEDRLEPWNTGTHAHHKRHISKEVVREMRNRTTPFMRL